MTNRFYDFIRQYGLWVFVLVAFLIYLKSLFYPFQLDDYITIVDNYAINNFAQYVKDAKWLSPNSRSLSFSLFALISTLFGKNPEAFRFFSIVLHLINGIAVFFISKGLLAKLGNSKDAIGPHIVAMIFLLHPVQLQTVVYITQQMAVLAAFFYLLSLWFYFKLRKNLELGKGFNFPLFAALTIAFVLGLKSKQTVATLPISIIVIELFFFSKSKFQKRIIFSILSFLLLAIISYLQFGFKTYEALGISRLDYLQTQVIVVFNYLQLFFYPKNLSIDHYFPIVNQLGSLNFWMALFVFLLVFAFGWFFRKKAPFILFGLSLFLIGLSVESSIFPIRDAMFEHRMYFPIIGLALLTSEVFRLTNYKVLTIILLSFFVTFSLTSFIKIEDWKSEKALWQNALKVSPNSPRANSYIGLIFMHENKIDSAKAYFEKAIELEPNHYESLNNLGKIYMDEEKYQIAIHYLNKAISVNPKNEYAHNNLGVCWESQKAYAQAIRSYGIAIRLNPNYEEAINNQAVAYEKFGQCDNAVFNYLRLEKINPNFPFLYFNLANCYLKSGNYLEGKKALLLSIEKDGENVDNLNNLGVSSYYLGETNEAIEYFKMALEIDSSRNDIKENLIFLTKKLRDS